MSLKSKILWGAFALGLLWTLAFAYDFFGWITGGYSLGELNYLVYGPITALFYGIITGIFSKDGRLKTGVLACLLAFVTMVLGVISLGFAQILGFRIGG